MSGAQTVQQMIDARGRVIDLLPPGMEEVTQLDAQYHDGVKDEWIELNQVDTERNNRYHDDAIAALAAGLPKDAVILELGSGVGYDAGRFIASGVPFGCYIVSEISPGMLEYSKKQLAAVSAGRTVVYCALDAGNMLLTNGQVDGVLAVAALHHFPDLERALAEIDRVTRPGAGIVFAMEPNRLWSAILVALRPLYRRLFAAKSHSAADEEAEGFTLPQLRTLGVNLGWKMQRVTPVWFITGFLHNGLEFLYRMLRLKKRICVPRFVERVCLFIDTIFLKLPFCDRLSWHYTAVYRK